jgi:hypothetical protein
LQLLSFSSRNASGITALNFIPIPAIAQVFFGVFEVSSRQKKGVIAPR